MKALTKEQQNLVENNHNLIYGYLHKNNLNFDDYYDIVAIGLCKASMGYKSSKGEFSTYAYKCINNEVGNYIRCDINGKTKIPENELISYDANNLESDGNETIVDRMESGNSNIEEEIIVGIDYLSFITLLNEKEQLVIEHLQDGLKQCQIAKEIGCTQQNISLTVKKIKEKWLKYYNN